MHAPAFLVELVLLLAAAVAVVAASHRVRLPGIVGLLIAGIVIGPSGLAFVAHGETVEAIAEIGVVALLFTIGLEFSGERIRALRRFFFAGGSMQMGLTVSMVGVGLVALGVAPRVALFGGFLVALSSTAIVLKLYAERRELEAPHGRLAFGILLFQDVALAPIIAITPLLGSAGGGAAGDLAPQLLLHALGVVAGFLIARAVLPPVFVMLAASRQQELLLMGGITTCLAAALGTAVLGFSPALGAFLAGLVLAESDVSHQVGAEAASFRDLFTSLFFVSIGMLLDLDYALGQLGPVLSLSAALVVVKAVAVLACAKALGLSTRVGVGAALGLAQIGEFSFVLAGVGREHGLMTDDRYQTFLASSILTMLATPALIAVAPRLGAWLERTTRLEDDEESASLRDHVIVVGYGVNGRNLARVLRETAIPFVVVELNAGTVAQEKARGLPIVFGDAARREILQHCGIERARAVVFAIPDPFALRRAIVLAKELNPEVHAVIRTRHLGDIEELRKLGADEVVAEEFETSIEILSLVLRCFHVPRNVTNAQISMLRADSYEMLRSASNTKISPALLDVLEAGTTDVFRVTPGSPAVGRTLAELDLRRATGTTVIAIVRDQRPSANPGADFRIEAGDSLVLVGAHAELESAFRFLSEEVPDT